MPVRTDITKIVCEVFCGLLVLLASMVTARFAVMFDQQDVVFVEPERDSRLIIKRIGWVFFLTFFLGMLVPGVVAAFGHVFRLEGLRKRIQQNQAFTLTQLTRVTGCTNDSLAEAQEETANFLTNQLDYRAKSEALVRDYFREAAANSRDPQLSNVAGAVEFEQKQLKLLKPPVDLVPYYPYLLTHANGLTPIWLFCFSALLVAVAKVPPGHRMIAKDWRIWNWRLKIGESPSWSDIFFEKGWWRWRLRPEKGKPSTSFPCLVFFSVVLIIYRSNLWLRNFLPWTEGRRLFAYSNFDIDPYSFVTMEAIDNVEMVLVFLVLLKFLKIYANIEPRSDGPAFVYATSKDVLHDLSTTYVRWQISSVLVGLPCLLSAVFYYDMIFGTHDHRYFPQAINSHLIWAVAWIIVSLPLLRRYYQWMTAKTEALGNAGQEAEVLEKLQPLGSANLTASAIIGAMSFLFPLIHAFLKT
jgi:hypothetical protein